MQSPQLAKEIRRGDRRALSKGITLVENEREGASNLLRMLKPSGHAFIVGVTGPPGTGKSTLVDRLIELYRKKGLRVGVIAVDPTSPITGGALLGDRIRMGSHAGDRSVYIRSMASRGWSGGLSRATSQVIQLMDAAGFDIILLETVGIGQSDIEVVGVSHAVLVVLMPGLGDDVQVSKAGLMEIGDVYVVNKADMEGSDSMVVTLLSAVRGMKSRSPPVIKVSALTGEGLEKLEGAIEVVRTRFDQGDLDLKLRSVKGMIIETARWTLMERLSKVSQEEAERLARLVVRGKLSIDEAAARLAR
ncbi:MAG: methylmalonyl Co-A mutase-associated GTPase MeaB [Nitrososphaerales archaeon]